MKNDIIIVLVAIVAIGVTVGVLSFFFGISSSLWPAAIAGGVAALVSTRILKNRSNGSSK